MFRWLWSTLLGRRSGCFRTSVSITTPSTSPLNVDTPEYEPERVLYIYSKGVSHNNHTDEHNSARGVRECIRAESTRCSR
ncbi:hypothetical protein BDR06DRAFT_957894 [Suillus hirtellus]|nr:hypothetical protein BDR06DRAFT_957894 [Suillus hirtellus]